MTEDQLDKVIGNIAKRVFERDGKKFSTVANISLSSLRTIKRVRRSEDQGKDAFTLLNVVQENIVRKGLLWAATTTTNKETQEVTTETKSKNRMENSMASIAMNKIISEEFLKGVA